MVGYDSANVVLADLQCRTLKALLTDAYGAWYRARAGWSDDDPTGLGAVVELLEKDYRTARKLLSAAVSASHAPRFAEEESNWDIHEDRNG